MDQDTNTRLRVVVVDDHEDLRMLVTMVLAHDDRFEIVGEGATGREAISLVENELPDLLLLDLAMPDMDGLEVLDECRKRWPGSPVIVVLSGFTAAAMRDNAVQRGAAGYMEKGSSFGSRLADELFETWQKHLATSKN